MRFFRFPVSPVWKNCFSLQHRKQLGLPQTPKPIKDPPTHQLKVGSSSKKAGPKQQKSKVLRGDCHFPMPPRNRSRRGYGWGASSPSLSPGKGWRSVAAKNRQIVDANRIFSVEWRPKTVHIYVKPDPVVMYSHMHSDNATWVLSTLCLWICCKCHGTTHCLKRLERPGDLHWKATEPDSEPSRIWMRDSQCPHNLWLSAAPSINRLTSENPKIPWFLPRNAYDV